MTTFNLWNEVLTSMVLSKYQSKLQTYTSELNIQILKSKKKKKREKKKQSKTSH